MEQVDTAKEAGGTAATAKEEGGIAAALPPSHPVVPPKVKTEFPPTPKYSIMSRRGTGRVGRHIPLMANHFKVSVNVPDAVFYQYTVCLQLHIYVHALYIFLWYLLSFILIRYVVFLIGFYHFRREQRC